DGHLVDNPRVGPELAKVWWQPGNSIPFAQFVRNLTGRELSAAPLALRLNQTADQRKAEALESVAKLAQIPSASPQVDLDARIQIVHGAASVAEYRGDFSELATRFAEWIDTHVNAAAQDGAS
ncbi:MAG TPA: hypothetical protein VER04_18800, partial [Polyangiaceae bacterium]|nr:hypothetical protein [Polyangiaceae bacterium]